MFTGGDHTRRDRRVRCAAMELDGATTNCATPIVQELERVVRAPRSAATAVRWTSKLVGVSALRDGMAWTAHTVVIIHTSGTVPTPAGLSSRAIGRMSSGIALLCAVCVK